MVTLTCIYTQAYTLPCQQVQTPWFPSTSEAWQDGSSGGLTVFHIMPGMRVWQKEEAILHNTVCVCVSVCVCDRLIVKASTSIPSVSDSDLHGYFPHLGLLSRFQQVCWQFTTGARKSLHHKMWVSLCVCMCVCAYHHVYSTSATWHQKR